MLSSTRLTLLGMALLGVGAALSYDNPVATPIWVLVMPMLLLAINLLMAILTNPSINQRSGLLLFHIGLLAIVVLAAVGRLTHFEAHAELVDGAAFQDAQLLDIKQGPWHRGDFEKLQFVQGPYSVDYRAGMKRGLTFSTIQMRGDDGQWQPQVIGDDRPLLQDGYRIYTTSNKGFAAVLEWQGNDGVVMTGAVNMPSYPLMAFRQANEWKTPVGEQINFWLQVDAGLDETGDWQLEPARAKGQLIINHGGQRVELSPGDSLSLQGGTLRYQRLVGWMGYKVFYDPTIHWLFISALLAVLGLALHYWQKFSTQPLLLSQQSSGSSSAPRLPTSKPV